MHIGAIFAYLTGADQILSVMQEEKLEFCLIETSSSLEKFKVCYKNKEKQTNKQQMS